MKLLHIGLDSNKTPPTSLMKCFPRHCTEYHDINTGHPNLNGEIIHVAKWYKPDFVFIQIQSEGINHEALKALKQSGAFVVNFTGDVRKPLPPFYISMGKLIDLTLFTNMNDVNEARKKGINAEFSVMGYDPDIYRPDYNVTKDIEVAFFGNHYGNQFPLSQFRYQMVTYLKGYFRNRFKVFGTGWSKPDGNYMHSQPEEAKVLNRCKIAVNVSHFEYAGYSSDRLNRTLGCGVMCITHGFPQMELLDLEDNFNCVVFRNLNDLSNKIEYYLEHETARKKIAAEGHKMATQVLAFDKMIEHALSFLPPDKHIELAAREIAKESK